MIKRITDDELDALAEFDSPFRIIAPGVFESPLADVYAPDVVDIEGARVDDVEIQDHHHEWRALQGFTGQHGYRGAVMHQSEYLGGGIAEHIIATPGVYCVVEVRNDDGSYPDTGPIGWAVVYYTED